MDEQGDEHGPRCPYVRALIDLLSARSGGEVVPRYADLKVELAHLAERASLNKAPAASLAQIEEARVVISFADALSLGTGVSHALRAARRRAAGRPTRR